MKIIKLAEINKIIKTIDLITIIEKSFIDYVQGKTCVPPVAELNFKEPPGDVHIKYGYIFNDDVYVIKIASGFYDNPKINLPCTNGLMLIFSQKTGELLAILLDEGSLTNLRTAAAGAIAAKYLAPRQIKRIGILGTGTQARLQLLYLKSITPCREVIIWGRNAKHLTQIKNDIKVHGFMAQVTEDIQQIPATCQLIVTTTPSEKPLLFAEQITRGTHITALGADSPHKQELAAAVLAKADLIVVDSIAQCSERGDSAHAIREKLISKEKLTELGNVILGKSPMRQNDTQITVADLTGLAVQDIAIAKAVFQRSL